jgi:hypothetical protein
MRASGAAATSVASTDEGGAEPQNHQGKDQSVHTAGQGKEKDCRDIHQQSHIHGSVSEPGGYMLCQIITGQYGDLRIQHDQDRNNCLFISARAAVERNQIKDKAVKYNIGILDQQDKAQDRFVRNKLQRGRGLLLFLFPVFRPAFGGKLLCQHAFQIPDQIQSQTHQQSPGQYGDQEDRPLPEGDRQERSAQHAEIDAGQIRRVVD